MVAATQPTNYLSQYLMALQSAGLGNAPNLYPPAVSVAPPVVQPVVATPAPTPAPAPAPAPAPTPTPSVADQQEALRKQFLGEVESRFGVGYGRNNIASSLLDDTINQILSEQRNDATSYLERGRSRGIYNDIGYNAGVANIGTASEAGRSKLYGLGNSIIDKYRADADAVRDKAYAAATAAPTVGSFSLDPYINEGNEVIARANTLASGDLRNTFGGTKLFDFGALNNRAGAAQGVLGTRDSDITTAIADRRRANAFGRGLGTQGAF